MRMKSGAVWSVPVPGLLFLGLVVGLGCFILVGPYAKPPPDLLSLMFTGRAAVRCRYTEADMAYTKPGINSSELAAAAILGGDGKMMASGAVVELKTVAVAKEMCNMPAYACCLLCSAQPLCLAFSKIPEGDSDKCRLVLRTSSVAPTTLADDRERSYVVAKQAKAFVFQSLLGAESGVPLDLLPSGNLYIYIYISTYTCTYIHIHTCVYITHSYTEQTRAQARLTGEN